MNTYFPIISNLITNGCLFIDTINSYLEIGVCEGISVKAIVQEYPGIKEVVLSDTWGGTYGGTARGSHEYVKKNLLNMGYPLEYITFLDGDSHITIPQYFRDNLEKKFDLCFVDGDHSIKGLSCDLENVLNHTLITAIHDVRHPAYTYLYEVCLAFYRQVHDRYIMIDEGAYLIYFIDKSVVK